MRSFSSCLVALFASAGVASAVVPYAAESLTGPYSQFSPFGAGAYASGGQALWGNVFTALPGGERILSVSVAYGSIVGAPKPVSVIVFEDPDNDGNPANAVPLATATGVADFPRTNTFITYTFTSPPVVSGTFYVAALYNGVVGDNIMRYDRGAITGVSYWATSPAGTPINLSNIGGSDRFFQLGTPGSGTLNGTFLVRATGTTIACNLADITQIGGTVSDPGTPDFQLTVDDTILFINLFGDGTGCPGSAPCSRADVTDIGDSGAGPDGQLTVDDVIAFFNAYGNGC